MALLGDNYIHKTMVVHTLTPENISQKSIIRAGLGTRDDRLREITMPELHI